MIDSRLPTARKPFALKALLQRFLQDLGAAESVRRAANELADGLDRAGVQAFFDAAAERGLDLAHAIPYFDVFARNMNALVRHEIRKTAVRTLHIEAAQNSFPADWQILPLEAVCTVPCIRKTFDCDHFQIIAEPWLSRVAAECWAFFGNDTASGGQYMQPAMASN